MGRVKIAISFLFFLLFATLSGCSSPEARQEKKDLRELYSYGLSEEQTKNFYGYTMAINLGLNTLNSINESIEGNDFSIPEKEKIAVDTSFNLAAKYFDTFKIDSNLIPFSETIESGTIYPNKTVKYMEEYRRTMTNLEAGMYLRTFAQYTSNAIKNLDVSSENKEKLFDYYVSHIDYEGVFKVMKEEAITDNSFELN